LQCIIPFIMFIKNSRAIAPKIALKIALKPILVNKT
jgi:hypothetical protein